MQHAGGQHEQRDVERHGLAPFGEDRVLRDQRGGGARPVVGQVERGVPVLAADADVHDAGALAEHEQRLAAGDDAVERLALPGRRCRRRGDDPERAVGDRRAHGACRMRAVLGLLRSRSSRRRRRRRRPLSSAASARWRARRRRGRASPWRCARRRRASAISDRKRTAATTIRKMTIRVGIERLQQRLGGKQTTIGGRGDDAAHCRQDRRSAPLCAGQNVVPSGAPHASAPAMTGSPI